MLGERARRSPPATIRWVGDGHALHKISGYRAALLSRHADIWRGDVGSTARLPVPLLFCANTPRFAEEFADVLL